MTKSILLASVAMTMARGFMSETVETVLIKGGPDGKGIRVNKADYDADQADGGEKKMKLHKEEADQSVAGTTAPAAYPESVPAPVAAPSAPDFSEAPAGEGAPAPLPIDPNKNAVAPAAPSANSMLVGKEGRKFFVVDGTGARVHHAAIDSDKGYASEADAWNAVAAAQKAGAPAA